MVALYVLGILYSSYREYLNYTTVCQCGVFELVVNSKAQPDRCLMLMKPKGNCITIVSAVLLLLGIEKMWQPNSFHNQWVVNN